MREATLPAGAAVTTRPLSEPPTAGPRSDSWWLDGGWREAFSAGGVMLIWSLVDRGYAGGRWWDVPAVKSFADPRLYRQDPFVWSLHDGTPAAYAYQLMAAVVRALPWLSTDQALLALYLPATLAALALLYLIALRLSRERAVAIVFVALYVAGFKLVSVGSAQLNSAEPTPQTLALPFQLGSLYALVTGRLGIAGLLMGLAFNLHAPSSVYVSGALGLYELFSWRRFGAGRVALSLGLIVLAGAPTFAGSLLHHGDQLPLWALNLAKADTGSDVSVSLHFSSRPLIIYNLLGLALAAVTLRAGPANSARHLTLLFGLAVGLMWLMTLLFFDFFPRTALSTVVARLQLPRSGWLVNLLGLLYITRYCVAAWRSGGSPRPLYLLLAAALLAAPPDPIPLDPLLVAAEALVLVSLFVPPGAGRRLLWWAPWVLAAFAALGGLAHLKLKELDFDLSLRTALTFAGLALGWALYELLRRRGWNVFQAAPALALGFMIAAGVQHVDDWLFYSAHKGSLKAAAEFQDWARTETPLDSVFLLMPGEPNNQTFYKYAERAPFLVRQRAAQAIYFREQSLAFESRVRALGVEQPLHYKEELDPAFRRLTEDQVRQLARDFSVTHFVPARAGTFSFPIVYNAGGWTVYEVR